MTVQLEAGKKKAAREREKVEADLKLVREQYRETSTARDTLLNDVTTYKNKLEASVEERYDTPYANMHCYVQYFWYKLDVLF